MATMSPGTTARKAMGLITFTDTEPVTDQLRRLANRLRHDQPLRDLIVRTTNVDNHNWERAAAWLDAEADGIDAAAANTDDPFRGLPTE